MESGIQLISLERTEQIVRHGRSVQHDVEVNTNAQLSEAARLLCVKDRPEGAEAMEYLPEGWDETIWQQMWDKPYKERLIIAGALIAAELDRLIVIDKQPEGAHS